MHRRVVFRVDASSAIGLGHAVRCRTLARALAARGWTIGFAAIPSTFDLVPTLSENGFGTVILGNTNDEADALRHAWPGEVDVLVVDHYRRGDGFESACRPWARRVVAFDDMPSRRHAVDLLIDQTAGRSADEYSGFVPSDAQMLVGSHYIMLRPEIAALGGGRPALNAMSEQVLVTFGGSDPFDLSARAITALTDERFNDLTATVVMGPGNQSVDRLRSAAPRHVSIVVDPPDFPELMARADIAISAAGTTCWELAFLGVPALVVTAGIGTVGQAMQDAGAAIWLGPETSITPGVLAEGLATLRSPACNRTAMSRAGQMLVDGKGAERAAVAIEGLFQ